MPVLGVSKLGLQYADIEIFSNVTIQIEERSKIGIVGANGSGKSSLINILNNNNKIKVADISDYYKLGKHTTTFSEMHKVDGNGFVIDTPGIKGFGLVDFDSNSLGYCFKEFVVFKKNCKFKSCKCINEPNCGVKNAVASNDIAKHRYLNYLSIIDEDNLSRNKL